jgi:hypothetical protein
MSFNIFKIFQIFGIVSAWSVKAFEDGKVTLIEAVELATQLCALLGIPADINLPTGDAPKIPEDEDTGDAIPTGTLARAPPEEEQHRKQATT